MNLTDAQLSTLKAWIVANRSSVYDQATVDALNATASPDYYIFKKTIPISEVMTNGFDWTMVDNANAGPARIWEWMMRISAEVGGVSPWKTTILKGVGEAWKGNTPAGKDTHRRAILRDHFCRKCTVFERQFVEAAADWNVGSNNDKTGNRGLNTNPDVMQMDKGGEYLIGPIDLNTVILSEAAA